MWHCLVQCLGQSCFYKQSCPRSLSLVRMLSCDWSDSCHRIKYWTVIGHSVFEKGVVFFWNSLIQVIIMTGYSYSSSFSRNFVTSTSSSSSYSSSSSTKRWTPSAMGGSYAEADVSRLKTKQISCLQSRYYSASTVFRFSLQELETSCLMQRCLQE